MFSIMLGVLASVLPNLFFYKLFFFRVTAKPKSFLRFVFFSEVLKFVGLALLLSLFLRLPNIQVKKLFAAFLLLELARVMYYFFWLATKRVVIRRK